VFESRVLRSIFGHERKSDSRLGKFEKLHNLYASLNIREKSRRMT
jgi:hypothetical protein